MLFAGVPVCVFAQVALAKPGGGLAQRLKQTHFLPPSRHTCNSNHLCPLPFYARSVFQRTSHFCCSPRREAPIPPLQTDAVVTSTRLYHGGVQV